MAGLSIAGSLAQTGVNLAQNFFNRLHENALRKDVWAREDSTLQRRVADARQAGISPLAGIGITPSANAVVYTPSATPMDANTMSGIIATEELGMKSTEMDFEKDKLDKELLIAEAQLQQAKSDAEAKRILDERLEKARQQAQIEIAKIQDKRASIKAQQDFELEWAKIEDRRNEVLENMKNQNKNTVINACLGLIEAGIKAVGVSKMGGK